MYQNIKFILKEEGTHDELVEKQGIYYRVIFLPQQKKGDANEILQPDDTSNLSLNGVERTGDAIKKQFKTPEPEDDIIKTKLKGTLTAQAF